VRFRFRISGSKGESSVVYGSDSGSSSRARSSRFAYQAPFSPSTATRSTGRSSAWREAAAELGAAFGSKGVALELALEAGPVVGDASRLSQIARNLLSNALKFTPSDGHVRVSTGREPEHAYLEVRDDGPGIEPSDLPYVFDRFWRGRNVADVSGSGIGLTVARELARAHGGEITVTSEPGRGAVFRVVLVRDPSGEWRASD